MLSSYICTVATVVTVGDFKKFTYGSKRTIVILLVILLVITIGFYNCLSNLRLLVLCCMLYSYRFVN